MSSLDKKGTSNTSNLVNIECPPFIQRHNDSRTGPTGPTGHIGYRGHTGYRGRTGPTGLRGEGLFHLISLDPYNTSFPKSDTILKSGNENVVSYVNTLEYFNTCIMTFTAPNEHCFVGVQDFWNSTSTGNSYQEQFVHFVEFFTPLNI